MVAISIITISKEWSSVNDVQKVGDGCQTLTLDTLYHRNVSITKYSRMLVLLVIEMKLVCSCLLVFVTNVLTQLNDPLFFFGWHISALHG